MGRVVLVTGGARSGKSSFALEEGAKAGTAKAFVATLVPGDEEMHQRVERHRLERGDEWDNHEAELDIASAVRALSESHNVIVVDCLTLWLSNLMHAGRDINDELDELCSALDEARASCSVFVVTNEVGTGIVPANETARLFRDLAGSMNQKVAALADEAYLMVSGLPLKLKGEN